MKRVLKFILGGIGALVIFIFLLGACHAIFSDGECDYTLEDYNGDGVKDAKDHDLKIELEEQCKNGG